MAISKVEPFQSGCKITLESPEHYLLVLTMHAKFPIESKASCYRLIDIDTGSMGEWKTGTHFLSVPPCLIEVQSKKKSYAALQCQRLPYDISCGWVFKFLLPQSAGELEHSLHILISGAIRCHKHSDISEGYRSWDPKTCQVGQWQVVGSGFHTKRHCVSFRPGIQIVEGSKRGPGIQCWPELHPP